MKQPMLKKSLSLTLVAGAFVHYNGEPVKIAGPR